MALPASPTGWGALLAGLCARANGMGREETLLKANILHRAVITGKLSFPQAGGACFIYTPWTSGFVVRPGSLCAFWSSVQGTGREGKGRTPPGGVVRGPRATLLQCIGVVSCHSPPALTFASK